MTRRRTEAVHEAEAATPAAAVKKAVIAECEKVITKPFIFGTNTSSLSVNEMARAATNPANVVGLHFFNPVHKMKLVELVRGLASSDEAIARARAYSDALGKTSIVVNEAPGLTTAVLALAAAGPAPSRRSSSRSATSRLAGACAPAVSCSEAKRSSQICESGTPAAVSTCRAASIIGAGPHR